MLDAGLSALATPGLAWIVLITLVAGIVYGFAGFGAGLVFMPVAVIFLPPVMAIATFSVSSMSSLVTVFPRALPLVHRKAVLVLILSAAVAASLGLWVLRVSDVTAIRWVVVTTRATTVVFLTATSLLMLPLMALQGILTAPAVALGCVLLVPYGAGALIGQALFRPRRERFYRVAAYAIISAATLAGVPLWDNL
ncbi:TSUP family transporter [Marivita sp.]|uniref:TSUP family transporter n=1 Tax=Marivita sp. TaxID=2003365 RepID=UPI0025C5DB8B|nr:TSUP family transporter [Marivita sp.]